MVLESCPSWECSVPGQVCNSLQPSPIFEFEVCANDCPYSNDGNCDDGGEGSNYDDCFSGSDCTDCNPRPPKWICCAEANAPDCQGELCWFMSGDLPAGNKCAPESSESDESDSVGDSDIDVPDVDTTSAVTNLLDLLRNLFRAGR